MDSINKITNEAIREEVRMISRKEFMRDLDENLGEAKVKLTVRRYNKILTSLGYKLEQEDIED